mgnify:CR=1 FL=1
MYFKVPLTSLTTFLNKVTKLLIPLVIVSLLLGIDVIGNITPLVEQLATSGVVGLLVLAVLMSLVK